MSVTLILGGARSGKSRRAEALASAHQGAVMYVATAPQFPDDAAWQDRLARHRDRRPADWQTYEEPYELAEVIHQECAPDAFVLVDCLTLWLSNWMLADRPMDAGVDALVEQVAAARGPLVLVSNEVGGGVHPATESGRIFRDHQGFLNQRMAAVADRVELMVAGIPLVVKEP